MAGVGHEHGGGGENPAAVPDVGVAGLQVLGGWSHENFVGGLPDIVRVGMELPAQAGTDGIYALRVFEVLAAEVADGEVVGAAEAGQEQAGRQQGQDGLAAIHKHGESSRNSTPGRVD